MDLGQLTPAERQVVYSAFITHTNKASTARMIIAFYKDDARKVIEQMKANIRTGAVLTDRSEISMISGSLSDIRVTSKSIAKVTAVEQVMKKLGIA